MKYIRDILELELNEEVNKLQRCSGGNINDVLECQTNNFHVALKINEAEKFPKMFDKEAEGLKLLSSTPFRIPKILKQGTFQKWSYLILEFINDKGSSYSDKKLGENLAKMHSITSNHFGLESDNYIGSIPQQNSLKKSWLSFYIEMRLQPLVKICFDYNRLYKSDIRLFEKLYLELDKIIPKEAPALLHGDLWQGNIISDEYSEPTLIDPAVYYGHREMDLSMLLLFGSISEQTIETYNDIFPLEKNWKERTDIHQLYPLLVHLTLFGESYLKPIQVIVGKYT